MDIELDKLYSIYGEVIINVTEKKVSKIFRDHNLVVNSGYVLAKDALIGRSGLKLDTIGIGSANITVSPTITYTTVGQGDLGTASVTWTDMTSYMSGTVSWIPGTTGIMKNATLFSSDAGGNRLFSIISGISIPVTSVTTVSVEWRLSNTPL